MRIIIEVSIESEALLCIEHHMPHHTNEFLWKQLFRSISGRTSALTIYKQQPNRLISAPIFVANVFFRFVRNLVKMA